MFRALRFRNFRWFLAGKASVGTGLWVKQIALGWLVYRLTDSAFYLGLLGGLALLPSFFLTPIAGVVADVYDRRRILLAMQGAILVHALALLALVWADAVTIPALLALSLGLGVVQGFDWTTRQSLVADLVEDRAALPNAIALVSTTFNSTRLIGPALAGAILAMGGAQACFALHAVACAVGLICALQLRMPRAAVRGRSRRELWHRLSEGALYSWREPTIRRAILLCGLGSGCVMPYVALLPLFAAEVFGGGAALYGALSATPALGAVAGGLVLAARREQRDPTRRLFVVGIVTAVALLAFAGSRWLPLSLVALVLLGGGQMMWIAGLNTQIQSAVGDDKRGRVLSFYLMAFMGAVPVGYFLYGIAAERLGVAMTCAIAAGIALAGNLWLHRSEFRSGGVTALRQQGV